MDFPVFSEYQDVFTVPLPTSIFATYSPPTWIPNPPALLKLAKAIYPYWKERRIERGGYRIIPTLNVCFRSLLIAA
jgi:enhancer of polycomb-like protein